MNNFINLESLIKQFNHKDETKKIIVIAGKHGVKKTYLLTKIWNYSYNGYKFEPKVNNYHLNRFMAYFNNNLCNIDYDHPYHRTTQKFTIKKVSDDIGYTILANLKLENISSWNFFNFFKKLINKWLIRKVQYKVSKINSSFGRINFIEKNKTLWPVLTTITSIGTSIGTPILSLVLFRQEALSELIGSGGVQAIIAICGILITSGVVSVLWYLLTNIWSSRKSSFNELLIKKYEKIYKKYFYLPSNSYDKKFMWKFQIKSSINYFYDDLSMAEEYYSSSISLFHILRNFNCNVFINVNIQEEYQLNNIYFNYFGEKENSYVYNISANYKENNNSKTIKFLIDVMSKILNVNLFFLYRRNFLFANFIKVFIDQSNASWQFFQFLEDLKTYVGEFPNLYKDKNYLNYFLEILPFLILKSVNEEDYLILISSLKNNLKIKKLILNKYETLKFDFIVQENWKHFKTFSLVFNIEQILEKNQKISEVIQEFSNFVDDYKVYQEIKKSLLNKLMGQKFVPLKKQREISNNFHNIIEFVNDYEELLLAFDIYREFKQEDSQILEIIAEIKKIGLKENASYIVLILRNNFIYLQKNHNDYEVADMLL